LDAYLGYQKTQRFPCDAPGRCPFPAQDREGKIDLLQILLPSYEIERMPRLIEVVPPRKEWFQDFATLKRALMRAAPDGAYIQHIGSTAVPDLPAKDIIDLQLTVDSLAWVDDAAFERQGFKRIPGLMDHSPSDLDLPEVELSKRFFSSLRAKCLHEVSRFVRRELG
jgi:GrpB-like predicted nucleotidyltransferase (UPF0157 family)